MPPILDAAIGTVFVFLLFSLVISALNELILSKLDHRANFLQTGLAELLGGKDKAEEFCKHGLINALSLTNRPSYIPAGAFVTALLDIVTKDGNAPQPQWSAAHAGLLTTLITDIQATKPGLPASYSAPLTAFTTAYGALAPLPAPESTLGKFSTRVVEAADRETAQAALLAAADRAAVDAIISIQTLPLQKELNALLVKSADALSVFKTSVQEWFDPIRDLNAVEGAASGTLALMVKPTVLESAETIKACINNLPPSLKLRESLLSLLEAAGNDVAKFKTAVEGWFNAAMDRTTGWYKRFAQKWMIVLGIILAAILNVDTIRIVEKLSKNPNLAKAVVAQAETYAKSPPKPQKTWQERKAEITAAATTEQKALDDRIQAEDTVATTSPVDQAKLEDARTARKAAESSLWEKQNQLLTATDDAFTTSIDTLKSTGIPMGWEDRNQRLALGLATIGNPGSFEDACKGTGFWAWFLYYPWVYTVNFFQHFWKFLPLIAGWFITALAASLGAPFWFDTLNRFVNIRNAGRTPGEKDSTSTATRPPPASLDKPLLP